MKKLIFPSKRSWEKLSRRPARQKPALEKHVQKIFRDVKRHGDKALSKYTFEFDKTTITNPVVSKQEIDRSSVAIPASLRKAIRFACRNIEKFHLAQLDSPKRLQTSPGVKCWLENRPVEKAGIYIPGGSAPLFSTVLMLAIPAKIAGCREIILCTPPGKDGTINPAILFAASITGVTKVIAAGGIQAIAALSMGTKKIPKADKIFGPGNQYVTAAKQYAQQKGTAIDMPAGPSELLVIADAKANPSFVAADLLSQAEHGSDSQVIVLSDNETMLDKILAELKQQSVLLPRYKIIQQSLRNSKAILLPDLKTCVSFSNLYAPEHLILACRKPEKFIRSIENAGSVFLGDYSPESAGDYASGTNHTLPTNGFAKTYSGVSVMSFMKKISFQHISKKGLQQIGPAIEIMAAAEALMAHKNAVTIRVK